MRNTFIILFLILTSLKIECQNTDITLNGCLGSIINETKSIDFSESSNDVNFRMHSFGNIIDIWKNGNEVGGEVTHYTSKLGKTEKIIFSKKNLDSFIVTELFSVIYSSDILNIKSDKEVEGWVLGYDGTTYTIEYSDQSDHWCKTYWSPQIQRDISEAIIVTDFVEGVSKILRLRESAAKFKEQLPPHGCYSNGNMMVVCYQTNSYKLGYSGTTRLPIGYSIALNLGYVGSLKTNIGLTVLHQMDTHGYYDFSASLNKKNIFIRNRKHFNDFVAYSYRQREYKNIGDELKFQNHYIHYGLNFKSTTIGVGIDILKNERSKIGGTILFNQYIPKAKFSILTTSSILKDQFDYKIGVSKDLNIKFARGVNLGLYYEQYKKHGSLGWMISSFF